MTWVVLAVAAAVVLGCLTWLARLLLRLWRATKQLSRLVAAAGEEIAEVTDRLAEVNMNRQRLVDEQSFRSGRLG